MAKNNRSKRLTLPAALEELEVPVKLANVNNINQPRPAGQQIVQVLPTGKVISTNIPTNQSVKGAVIAGSKAKITRASTIPVMTQKISENYSSLGGLMREAALYVTCPSEARNIPRYNPGLGYRETAAATPVHRIDVNYTASSDTVEWLDDSKFFCAKFRDPVRSAVFWDGNPEGLIFTYASAITSCKVEYPEGNPQNQHWNYMPYVKLDWMSGYKIHGDTLFPGRSKHLVDGGFYWVGRGNSLSARNDGTVSCQFNFEGYKSDGGVNSSFSGTALPTQSVTYVVPIGATYPGEYVRVGFRAATTVNLTPQHGVTLTLTGSNGDFAHRSSRSLRANLGALGEVRHVAASVMYTNTSAPLYRQGVVSSKQIQKELQWNELVLSRDPYAYIASLSKPYNAEVTEGYYGFVKPAEFSDLELFDQTIAEVGAGLIVGDTAFFWLENDAEYLAFATTVNDPQGHSAVLTISDGLEYVSDDQFRSYSSPTMRAEDWRHVLEFVGRSEQHFTNWSHLAALITMIRKALKGGAGAIQAYGPGLINLATWLNKNL